MLQWLLGLFHSSADKPATKSVASATDGAALPTPFLRRESMLDSNQMVAAYLFSVPMPAAMQSHAWQATSRRFFDSVLIDHFASDKLAEVLDKRLAFLPLSDAGLDNPKLMALPRENLVIEFDPPAGAAFDRVAVLEKLQALRDSGFQLSCGHTLAEIGLPDALEISHFINLGDVSTQAPPDLLARCRVLASRYPESRLVARNIDSIELYQACQQMGIHLFQGRFLTHRGSRNSGGKIATYRMVVVDLLNAIKRQADFEELAGIAWRDPALAYRLLRFVNSAAMGLREKIDRLKTAMVYVGRDELYRWLTLLLFSSKKPSHLDSSLRENALVRARLVEKLADGRMPPKERDEAFVVGILSVIDALLEMPMQDALAQLSLPDAITQALLNREGRYAPYLNLAIACEDGDQASIEALAIQLGMDAAMVNQRHIDALIWAMSFSEALEDSHIGA